MPPKFRPDVSLSVAQVAGTVAAMFVMISMQMGATPYRFGPTMTKLDKYLARGNVCSHVGVGLSF
jgi:hypothetical protein